MIEKENESEKVFGNDEKVFIVGYVVFSLYILCYVPSFSP